MSSTLAVPLVEETSQSAQSTPNTRRSTVISPTHVTAAMETSRVYKISRRDEDEESIDSGYSSSGWYTAGGVGRAGQLSAFFNTSNMCVGIGILALPKALEFSGWALGVISLLVIAVVTFYSVRMIVAVSAHLALQDVDEDVDVVHTFHNGRVVTPGYVEVVRRCLGVPTGILVTTLLCIAQLGANIAYLIFIANSLYTHFGVPLQSSLCWSVVLLLPLCCMRSVKKFSVFSLIGIISMVIGLIAAVYWGVSSVIGNSDHKPQYESPALQGANWHTYPLFLGIASLSFEGVAAMALPIENSMADPSKFKNVLGCAVLLILVLNLWFASTMVVAVSEFRQDVPGVITEAMPSGAPVSQLVSVCLSLELLFTYPGNAIPLFKLFERSRFSTRTFGDMSRSSRIICFSIIRIIVVAFTGVTAFLLSDYFDIFLSLVGSVANASILFVFPGLCFIASSTHEDDKRRYRFAAVLVVSFGIAVAVIGTAIGARTALHGEVSAV
ncbi:neutral amino acid transporter [Perkinsus chesapeaki]|uniref:Neutral amino acid transporter n=1 Tax=Perkinsus chesapeaki TaxID=330153 RepID=A0A7J6LKK2_PERCH|nr:neutral amino acid transporter [Perkinsus chesapeaki]